MKIDREKHPFLSQEDFEKFLEQLTPLEVDALLEAVEEKNLGLAVINQLRAEAKIALEEVADGVKEIEQEVTRIRSNVEKWNKPKLSVSPAQALQTGNGHQS